LCESRKPDCSFEKTGRGTKGGKDFQDLSDHFGGHPKTAGRTFTGGAERNLKAET
jgi:hypothetical protein